MIGEIEVRGIELPDRIDVDDYVDPKGIHYFGIARRRSNGKYGALADVGDGVARFVEITITLKQALKPDPKTPFEASSEPPPPPGRRDELIPLPSDGGARCDGDA